MMDESGFAPLMDAATLMSDRASGRKSWPVMSAVALLALVLVSAVSVVLHTSRDGPSSSLFATSLSNAAVSNGTFNAYSNLVPRSCAGQPDGLTWIRPNGQRPIQVFCEGEWLLMQKRSNPSVNFHRDWTSYRTGFGDETNFWVGNDNLHAITSGGARLRVVLTDADDTERYAEYSTFSVADEDENFAVVFDDYHGDAGEALSAFSGHGFSTWDADHDTWSRNCAETYFGGWWYSDCHDANLNGLYLGPGPVTASHAVGITWSPWKGQDYSLKTCYMWVQPNE